MNQRDTKLRAWNREKRKMYYLDSEENIGKPYDSVPHFCFYAGGCWDLIDSNGKVLVNNVTGEKMDFAYLKDLKEIGIYEWDIVKVFRCNEEGKIVDQDGNFEVYYDDVAGLWNLRNKEGYFDNKSEYCGGLPPWLSQGHDIVGSYKVEVIGNIYENPELLK